MLQLDEDGLKEKKKQRLLRAGYEARERARKEKEREREEREAEERKEEEERDRDLAGWATKLRKEHDVRSLQSYSFSERKSIVLTGTFQAIINKIKDRNRRKAALTDRKSAASQARMKSIANLAADERVPKKRRKNGGGGLSLCTEMWHRLNVFLEDMFGADDADWQIYRKIVSYLGVRNGNLSI